MDEVTKLRRAEEVERQLLLVLREVKEPDSLRVWVLRCCLAQAMLEVRKARAAYWATALES